MPNIGATIELKKMCHLLEFFVYVTPPIFLFYATTPTIGWWILRGLWPKPAMPFVAPSLNFQLSRLHCCSNSVIFSPNPFIWY
jgi:hypothetical protein